LSQDKNNPEHYVDIRFTFKEETEEYGDETYTRLRLDSISRHKSEGVSEDDFEDIGETLAQTDHYQMVLVNEVSQVLYDGKTYKDNY
jgi:hypothetical protein